MVPSRIADWKYWDAAALVASMLVFTLMLFAHEGPPGIIGIALFVGAILVFAVGLVLSWRQGDARLAATGGLLVAVAVIAGFVPLLLSVFCLLGDCV